MICREKMKINYIKMKCTKLIDIIMLQLSWAKPGNPASTNFSSFVCEQPSQPVSVS